jgi:hypothetical protein
VIEGSSVAEAKSRVGFPASLMRSILFLEGCMHRRSERFLGRLWPFSRWSFEIDLVGLTLGAKTLIRWVLGSRLWPFLGGFLRMIRSV